MNSTKNHRTTYTAGVLIIGLCMGNAYSAESAAKRRREDPPVPSITYINNIMSIYFESQPEARPAMDNVYAYQARRTNYDGARFIEEKIGPKHFWFFQTYTAVNLLVQDSILQGECGDKKWLQIVAKLLVHQPNKLSQNHIDTIAQSLKKLHGRYTENSQNYLLHAYITTRLPLVQAASTDTKQTLSVPYSSLYILHHLSPKQMDIPGTPLLYAVKTTPNGKLFTIAKINQKSRDSFAEESTIKNLSRAHRQIAAFIFNQQHLAEHTFLNEMHRAEAGLKAIENNEIANVHPNVGADLRRFFNAYMPTSQEV